MSRQLMSVLVLAFLALYLEQTAGWNYYCQMSDIIGTWKIERNLDTTDDFVHCWHTGSDTLEHTIRLDFPDVASDEYGNYGHWTSIYGIAVEITIHGRKYYTFFNWNYDWRIHRWSVDCNNLEVGQSRDILTNNYACFSASKGSRAEKKVADPEPSTYPPHPPTFNADPTFTLNKDPTPTNVPTEERRPEMAIDPSQRHEKFQIDFDLVESINNNDMKLWEAHPYDFLKDITNEDLIMMAGGNMSTRGRPPKLAERTEEQLKKTLSFPRTFDWRNVDGKSYVSPVRNQGYCGSCYAFAAAAAYESRLRILTDNTVDPILSTQDVVNCNPYTYGCWGGWIFTEGKYGEEFGFVDEMCNPYSGEGEQCSRDPTCIKYYSTDYQYVGGFFGGSNDLLMMDAIYNNGPVVVGYAVYLDFVYYRSGVYYHSGPDRLLGYHAVAVVGWGQDERSGTKYWIVKNSWGKNWGENGYFRFIRGSNDCDLESEAFEAFPIL